MFFIRTENPDALTKILFLTDVKWNLEPLEKITTKQDEEYSLNFAFILTVSDSAKVQKKLKEYCFSFVKL
jgi:DNA polymerase III delta prime subunit